MIVSEDGGVQVVDLPFPVARALIHHTIVTILPLMKAVLLLLAAVLMLGGSAPAATFTVNNNADSGLGSLRQAVLDATAAAGADTIVFALALSGGTITLTSGQIVLSSDLTIDASGNPGGVTINGNNASQIFYVSSFDRSVALNSVALTGANGGAIFKGGGGSLTLMRCILSGNRSPFGGAIISQGGAVTVVQCTVSENNADQSGGAIFVLDGSLTLTSCTVSGNQALRGGAIYFAAARPSLLTHCTISGNIATVEGGGVFDQLTNLILTHCTISGNTAPTGKGSGVFSGARTVVANSVIAGNVNSDVDSGFSNSFTSNGHNLVGTGDAVGPFNTPGDVTGITNPLLAPLGNYGGFTQTRALLPGSPARNAGAVLAPPVTGDQRGFPIVGTPDIGAYEAGTFTHYDAWAWETLPATASAPQHASVVDFDSDGVINGNEWLALTDPGDSGSFLRVSQTAFSGGVFNVTFPTVLGRNYSLDATTNLGNPNGWATVPGSSVAGTGGPVTIPIAPFNGIPTYFVRIRVGP